MLTIAAIFLSLVANAQKPALDHSVYDGWKSISMPSVPSNGEWLMYNVTPQEGDACMHFYDMRTGAEYSVPRARMATISKDGKRAVMNISPLFAQSREARIKKSKDEMSRDTLAILDLRTGELQKIAGVKSYRCGEKLGNLIFYKFAADPNAKKEAKPAKEEKPAPKAKKDESWKNTLVILNIENNLADTLKNVDGYALDENVENIAYIYKPSERDSLGKASLRIYNIASKESKIVLEGEKKSYFSNPNYIKETQYLSYFANLDTSKDNSKRPDIYLYDGNENRVLLSSSDKRIPSDLKIGTSGSVSFNYDHTLALVNLERRPHEKDTTIPDFEKAKLDIWTWNEDYLQSVQVKRVGRDRSASYQFGIGMEDERFIRFSDPDFPNIHVDDRNRQEYMMALCDKPYRVQQQWNQEPLADLYRVSLKDGSRTLVEEGVRYRIGRTSPDGRYYVYYRPLERDFYIYDIVADEHRNLTKELGRIFYDDENDRPQAPSAISTCNWVEDSKTFYIGDKYDIWRFDATGEKAPVMVTEGRGEKNNVTYEIINPWSSDNLPKERRTGGLQADKPLYFSTFDHVTKKHGYSVLSTGKKPVLTDLCMGPATYKLAGMSLDAKGRNPRFAYVKGNYETGNNMWVTADNFKSEKQISDINPQQRDYNWGTVELVSWTARDGNKAEGLLFKPEDFDPAKKYPVMIYFYERYSDDLYAVRNPAPSRSTVNIPFFVSNGYICFIPDIRYTVGHPGQSAMDYIMPACDMLCTYPWIDGENMAIQGQSWGGYQVAYMITQTGRFKAAGSGAPVSNMTSAYGGIRWGSGVTREFQYEQQQSRIGKNLWDGFDLYVENSPLFHVPNVTTPVLIMHNDMDDAVPWWQGIEFFTALRRCGKTAWMLQYNDETHNLSRRPNAKDLSVRLQEFFDHYLKGAPMPDWMKYGVPAVDKE